MCVCVCVCVCARARVCVCVCVCVHARFVLDGVVLKFFKGGSGDGSGGLFLACEGFGRMFDYSSPPALFVCVCV